MLTQRLTVDEATNSGVLTIESGHQNLAELLGLGEELKLRLNIRTEGTLTSTAPADPVIE